MIATNPIHEVCDYGSSAVYCSCPSPEQVASGVVPLDSLPAAWWNWMWNDTNKAVNQARQAVGILIDEVDSVLANAGVCVNPNCVDQLYQAINKIRSTIGNAVTAGAVKSSTCGGQVTIENDGTMTMNGVGNAANLTTTAHTVVGAINELKTTYDCCVSDLSTCIGTVDNSKAPTNHASANATYGVGNASCYGHVMLSDDYTCCVGAAADGVAASQMAVYCLYTAIGNAASLGNTAGCAESEGGSIGICATAARSDHTHPYPYHFCYTWLQPYISDITHDDTRLWKTHIYPVSSATVCPLCWDCACGLLSTLRVCNTSWNTTRTCCTIVTNSTLEQYAFTNRVQAVCCTYLCESENTYRFRIAFPIQAACVGGMYSGGLFATAQWLICNQTTFPPYTACGIGQGLMVAPTGFHAILTATCPLACLMPTGCSCIAACANVAPQQRILFYVLDFPLTFHADYGMPTFFRASLPAYGQD